MQLCVLFEFGHIPDLLQSEWPKINRASTDSQNLPYSHIKHAAIEVNSEGARLAKQ